MKSFSMKRALCVLSAAALILTTGCGNQNSRTDGGPGNSQGETQESSLGDPGIAMGRYAEEELDLTQELETVSSMKKLPDGTLIITDTSSGIWESKDSGATWENANSPWLDEMFMHAYFMDLQAAPDGTLGVIYSDYGEENGEEEEEYSAFDFHPVCELVKPDGTVVPVEISLSEDEMYPYRIWFSDSGRIFVTTLGDKIYEVHEDGSSEHIPS